MTRTRKSTARCNGEEQPDANLQPPKASAQTQTTSAELERQMQSALEDVYEVLQLAGNDADGIVWAELELVNDLTH